jgi:tetratricopeptide (TPR) repeat protein
LARVSPYYRAIMAFPVLFFFAAMAVNTDPTPLRSGCGAEDQVVASLPAGTPVQLRFRLSDGTDCFKVSASLGGKDVLGYVPASALTGLAQYDEDRSAAASVEVSPVAASSVPARPASAANQYMLHTNDPALLRAAQSLNESQPAQALEQLQTALQRHPPDPKVLMLAGLAAYRSDQLRPALDYWKQSLDLAPNQALNEIYQVAKREAEADRSGEKLYGAHIALRYEGEALPVDTARAILATLDDDYSRISAQLGCSSGERIVAIVQNRESYLRSTGAAEWSGGQYDGRIHIAWTEGAEVGPEMQRALAHELVHACLTSIPSGSTPWPAWLQEGLAQKLSGDLLRPSVREQLRQLAATHAIPRLENLGQDWSSMAKQNAVAAYSLALSAADALYDNYSNYGIRNVLRNPERLPGITADLDQKLGF